MEISNIQTIEQFANAWEAMEINEATKALEQVGGFFVDDRSMWVIAAKDNGDGTLTLVENVEDRNGNLRVDTRTVSADDMPECVIHTHESPEWVKALA